MTINGECKQYNKGEALKKYETKSSKRLKIIIAIMLAIIISVIEVGHPLTIAIRAEESDKTPIQSRTTENATSTPVTPNTGQYLEMRATKVKQLSDGSKQLLFELIAHNIEFQVLDLRFTYDTDNLELSNINTNEEETDLQKCFKSEEEFENYLQFFRSTKNLSVIKGVLSFKPP